MCIFGECVATNQCKCDSGYGGTDCAAGLSLPSSFSCFPYPIFRALLFQVSLFTFHFSLSPYTSVALLYSTFALHFRVSISHFNFAFQFCISILHFNFAFQFRVSVLHSILHFNFAFQFCISILHSLPHSSLSHFFSHFNFAFFFLTFSLLLFFF